MIDHTGVAVSDVAKSKAFYRAALAPLGYALLMEFDDVAGFGVAPKPDFWIGKAAADAPPVHVAFRADSRAQVDAFYKRGDGRGRPRQRSAGPAAALSRRTTTARSCSIRTVTTSKRCVMRRRDAGASGHRRWRRRATSLRGRCCRLRASPALAQAVARQADQVRRRRAGTGQLARHARAHDRRQAEGSPRPAGHRREQARGRRHRRHRRGREGGARRLHDAAGLQRAARLRPAAAEAPVRRAEGSRAGDHHVEPAQRARGQRRSCR